MSLKAKTSKGEKAGNASKAKKELFKQAKECDTIAQELEAFRDENEEIFIVLDMLQEKYAEAADAAKLAARVVYVETNKDNKGSNVLFDEKDFMVSVASGGWKRAFDLPAWRKANKKKDTDFPAEAFFVTADPKYDHKKYEEALTGALQDGDEAVAAVRKFASFVTKEVKTPKVTLGHPDEVLSKKEAQRRALKFIKG